MSCKDKWAEIAKEAGAWLFVPAVGVDGGQRCRLEECAALIRQSTQRCLQGHAQGAGVSSWPFAEFPELEALHCAFVSSELGEQTSAGVLAPVTNEIFSHLFRLKSQVSPDEESVIAAVESAVAIFDSLEDWEDDPRVEAARRLAREWRESVQERDNASVVWIVEPSDQADGIYIDPESWEMGSVDAQGKEIRQSLLEYMESSLASRSLSFLPTPLGKDVAQAVLENIDEYQIPRNLRGLLRRVRVATPQSAPQAGIWSVHSSTRGDVTHTVSRGIDAAWSCTCERGQHRHSPWAPYCRHIKDVRDGIETERRYHPGPPPQFSFGPSSLREVAVTATVAEGRPTHVQAPGDLLTPNFAEDDYHRVNTIVFDLLRTGVPFRSIREDFPTLFLQNQSRGDIVQYAIRRGRRLAAESGYANAPLEDQDAIYGCCPTCGEQLSPVDEGGQGANFCPVCQDYTYSADASGTRIGRLG